MAKWLSDSQQVFYIITSKTIAHYAIPERVTAEFDAIFDVENFS
jgi:hypothetical protein